MSLFFRILTVVLLGMVLGQVLIGHVLQIPPEQIVQAIRREAVSLTKVIEMLGRARMNRYKSEMPRVAVLY